MLLTISNKETSCNEGFGFCFNECQKIMYYEKRGANHANFGPYFQRVSTCSCETYYILSARVTSSGTIGSSPLYSQVLVKSEGTNLVSITWTTRGSSTCTLFYSSAPYTSVPFYWWGVVFLGILIFFWVVSMIKRARFRKQNEAAAAQRALAESMMIQRFHQHLNMNTTSNPPNQRQNEIPIAVAVLASEENSIPEAIVVENPNRISTQTEVNNQNSANTSNNTRGNGQENQVAIV